MAVPAAAAHAFVTDLDAPDLRPDDEHHLFRALRLRPGEAVTVSDGAGRWRRCTVGARGLEPAGDVVVEPRSEPPIAVAFALTKGERPEWVVQKLTELGVDEIRPMTTRHTVVRWDHGRRAKAMARLREVARSAAMQARLAWLPAIGEPCGFDDALAAFGAGRVAVAHPGGQLVS
ncbi:MAG: 16S rRNA (uracil(1498)-N(3))-methyltransferase, partial [Actinobacteria bacterium]|nr:16S rRNA (uracil(1498)-N(3))-methyltransferase [Actinomycetota bacterium]